MRLAGILAAAVSYFHLAPLIAQEPADAPAPPVPSPSDFSRRLDEYMQMEVRDHRFSGAVLVAQNGQVLLAGGYGYANLEWDARNTRQTRFRIGSLTKPFTASLILQLREKKLLDVTDPICKHLQPCPEAWKPVTLHHLLSHTSGIPNAPRRQEPPEEPGVLWTAEQIAAAFREQPLEFVPGEHARYNDWGYYLLGLVVEKVAGKPYEAVLREQILDPLGMRDTGYDRPSVILKRRASGYRLEDGELLNADYIDMSEPYAAGGMYSTVEDLFKWDQALYRDSVLPAPALTQMWTPVMNNFGYGWLVSEPTPTQASPAAWWAIPGRLQVCHSGGINGFASEYLRFPNERVTVIVLANMEAERVVAPFLAAILLGEKYSLPESAE
jgi:CubicO group peptidase (beta-lactamase class C family)